MSQQATRTTSTRPRRPQMVMEVVAIEDLSPTFKRITFGGEDFDLFQDSEAVDKYVKLLLPQNPAAGLTPFLVSPHKILSWHSLHSGIEYLQDKGTFFPLMSNKVIHCYI